MEGERRTERSPLPHQPGGKGGIAALRAEPFGVDPFKERDQPAAAPLILRDQRIGAVRDLDETAAFQRSAPSPNRCPATPR